MVLLGDGLVHRGPGQLGFSKYVAHALLAEDRQEDFVVLVVLRGWGRLEVREGGVRRDAVGRLSRRRVDIEVGRGRQIVGAARGELSGSDGLQLPGADFGLTQHGPKEQLRGLTDGMEDGTSISDARHAHVDVFTLEVHRCAGHSEAVHAVVQDRDDLLHVGRRRLGGRLIDNGESAREVETEFGTPAKRKGRRERAERDGNGENEADDH